MENSKEIKKLDEKELEKVNGGYFGPATSNWFAKNKDEIFRRAREKDVLFSIIQIIQQVGIDEKKWSINDFKNALSAYINVDDLD